MCGYDFADAFRRRGAGIDGAAHGCYFTAHDGSHQSGVNLFIADEMHVCGFNGGVGGLNHSYQTAAFDHSEGFSFHNLFALRLVIGGDC
jgi:hypothetical protein